MSTTAGADDYGMKATLLDVNGAKVGRVKFSSDAHHSYVKVRLTGAPGADAFHGFHIHANNDPANGEGCVVAGKFASADALQGSWSEPWPAHRRSAERVCER
jgi:superoxide dismutase, Cu-Zn family